MRWIKRVVAFLVLGTAVACELVTEPDYGSIPCAEGRTRCDGACWDLGVANAHCGACGNSCQYPYQECTGGVCGCAQGTTLCSGVCTQLYGDPQNCGGCGKKCAADQYCVGGNCQKSCRGYPYLLCGSDCVDVMKDPSHCGGCGFSCSAAPCVNGFCGAADAGDADTDDASEASDASDEGSDGEAGTDADAELEASGD